VREGLAPAGVSTVGASTRTEYDASPAELWFPPAMPNIERDRTALARAMHVQTALSIGDDRVGALAPTLERSKRRGRSLRIEK
jgi:hypothetical protein